MIDFEYDNNKSLNNKLKHGIDFEEGKELWNDLNAVFKESAFVEEPRIMITGLIKEKFWTAVITFRENKIRIISVRRARIKEILRYENKNNNC